MIENNINVVRRNLTEGVDRAHSSHARNVRQALYDLGNSTSRDGGQCFHASMHRARC